jgi:Cytidylate kinase-like family
MIVTISRQLGSEGDLIAARVASTLGLLLVDREYTCKAALAAGMPTALLQKLMYEGQHSLAGQIMDSLGSTPPDPGDRSVP